MINRDAYLERINYHGPLAADADSLRELQLAQLRTVPFENLSIHAHEPIVLNDEALYSKIVERRRGGFCYEANGLFAALLRSLGFKVAMVAAEVANAEGGFGLPFDHMALIVTLEQRWLVDVGFGDSFLEPLLLDKRSDQVQHNYAYRIGPAEPYLVLSRRSHPGADKWQPQYRFTLQPYEYQDFEEMCHYHQTSPQSHFTQRRICSRATPEGRITLSEMRLITSSQTGDREEQILTTQEEYDEALRGHFGVVMS